MRGMLPRTRSTKANLKIIVKVIGMFAIQQMLIGANGFNIDWILQVCSVRL